VSNPASAPAPAKAVERPGKRDIAMAVLATTVRIVIAFALIGLILSLVPDVPDGRILVPVILVAGAIAMYVWYFRHQVKSIYGARYPTLRAVESIILVAAMFLAIFALFYVTISVNDRAAFTEPLDAFNGYYFSLTVLATVGFGDITPVTFGARLATMVQMALDLAFIGVAFKVIGGAARSALQTRKEAPDMPVAAEAVED
jgi:heme/copper-type cytochrome/quinol oxidase subunit 2